MFDSKLMKWLTIFTILSIGLGLATVFFPPVAEYGWIIGTLISILGGISYGRVTEGTLQSLVGGAIVGGVSIALGCSLAFLLRSLPIEGVFAATIVGMVSGAVASLVSSMASKKMRVAA